MVQPQTFYFSEGPYLQALQGLHAALSSPEAFVKLLGGAQTGKSVLCAKLTQYMRRKGYQVIYFNAAVESPDMLRTILARELKLPVSSNFSRLLEDTLQLKDEKPIVLIFDDAHLLTDITLLEIYRLAEVQVNRQRVLNILLSGDMSLEKRLLSSQEFKSLLLSVSNRFVLEPMDRATLDQFFYRYAEKSGVPGLQLDVSAMNYLYKSCRGYPGPALSMCRLVLESRMGSTDINPVSKAELAQILKNASSLGLVGKAISDSKKIKHLAPLAAVIAIASIGLMYQQLQSGTVSTETEPLTTDVGAQSPFQQDPEPQTQQMQQDPQAQPANIEIEAESVVANAEQADDIMAQQIEPEDIEQDGPEALTSLPVPTEIPEPVSDSSLALVTAEEIGVSSAAISEPEFETLVEDEESEVEQQSEITAEPEPVAEPLETEPDEAAVNPVESEEVIVAADLPVTLADELESSVRDWLLAWQSQSLEDYFFSYHSQFVPRYQDSVNAWRSNRERVIGNAASITLEMSEFEHVGMEEGLQDVRFWLHYQSANYSDNTQKKLLLDEEGGAWKIVEEINLQVRR